MTTRTPGRTNIQDLWTKRAKNPDGTFALVPSKRHGRGRRWRAVIVDERGEAQSEAFQRKDDARRWLDQQLASMVTGTYIDPRLGKTTLSSFYREWSRHQVWTTGTQQAMDRALGHGSASVTLNTYAHLWPDANDRTRQAARDLYAESASAYQLRTEGTENAADQQL